MDEARTSFEQVLHAENSKMMEFKIEVQHLQANSTSSSDQAEFPDGNADLRLLLRQATTEISKIKSTSKRRRTSLLQTVALLGQGSNDGL